MSTMHVFENIIKLFNTNVHDMLDRYWSPDIAVQINGFAIDFNFELAHSIEEQVRVAAPDRKITINRAFVQGEVVAFEASLSFTDSVSGETRNTGWCGFWTIKDGLLVVDHSYFDPGQWPGVPAPDTANN